MKILLIVDDYLPHSIKIAAKMMHELAVEFKARGNEITVITPDVTLIQNFKMEILDGVKVFYFKSGRIKNVNLPVRALNEFLMPFRAWKYLKKELLKDSIDSIIYYSPSIFWSFLIAKLKKAYRCNSFMVLRDIFPQWIIDNGIIKRYSPIAYYFKFFEKLNYRYADFIALQSPKNLEWFNRVHNRSGDKKTILLYNWAKNSKIEKNSEFREKFSLCDKIIFFYGGNIGHAQDMMNLFRLAEKMKDEKDAVFVFLGEGDEVGLIQSMIEKTGLKNLVLLPSVNQNEFKKILADVDVGLFSLAKSHKTHNFPGKLLGYMVQQIPVLGSVNTDNDLKNVFEDNMAGFISINGEDELLYKNALQLLKNPGLRFRMGINSEKLLRKMFSVESAADTIISQFTK